MKYGLVVDELHDSEEIVVKPLGQGSEKVQGIRRGHHHGRRPGCADPGRGQPRPDGRPDLHRRIVPCYAEVALKKTCKTIREQKDRQSLLVFRSAENEQFAAPLNMVERIEKIKATDIESGRRQTRYPLPRRQPAIVLRG
jgi:two-component system chemotaxis sensor kinase CheA